MKLGESTPTENIIVNTKELEYWKLQESLEMLCHIPRKQTGCVNGRYIWCLFWQSSQYNL